ncbi:hypothetical protein QJQ45_005822 [Haematococcus lacustris]|nr:hypothetical protein QJQ45_005822 [Haematococcus lacustris]
MARVYSVHAFPGELWTVTHYTLVENEAESAILGSVKIVKHHEEAEKFCIEMQGPVGELLDEAAEELASTAGGSSHGDPVEQARDRLLNSLCADPKGLKGALASLITQHKEKLIREAGAGSRRGPARPKAKPPAAEAKAAGKRATPAATTKKPKRTKAGSKAGAEAAATAGPEAEAEAGAGPGAPATAGAEAGAGPVAGATAGEEAGAGPAEASTTAATGTEAGAGAVAEAVATVEADADAAVAAAAARSDLFD